MLKKSRRWNSDLKKTKETSLIANTQLDSNLFGRVASLIEQARTKVAATINQEMVVLYWNIGKMIKEEIMKSARAEYGQQIVQSLTAQLISKYGKGFSKRNLWYMIQLYDEYPDFQSLFNVFKGLNWTHVIILLPIKEKLQREFYATLCAKDRWSTRVLSERINSMVFERTALSKLPEETIKMQLKELREQDKMTPEMVFKDPYVLDFFRNPDTIFTENNGFRVKHGMTER